MTEIPAFPTTLMRGKNILITGGTQGIGLEIAAQLAEAGASVVISGRDRERGNAALEDLRSRRSDGDFTYFSADLRNYQSCRQLLSQVEGLGRPLNGLINCAVSTVEGARGKFAAIDPDAVRPMFEAGVISLMNIVHTAVPYLSAAGGGTLVTFASDSGKIAGAWQTMVGANMSSTMMFTRSLALELAKDGISVNCVSPSYVRGTEIYRRISGGASGERIARAEKGAGLGLPDAADVARLAVFLSSPWAAHISGQVISVNGGLTAA